MTKRITKARMERIEKEEALFERIFKCAEEIRECEDELSAMGVGDRWSDGENEGDESAWYNFRDGMRQRLRLSRDLGDYGGNPCYAVAALLDKMVSNAPEGAEPRGCAVSVRGKSAVWVVSGVLDGGLAELIRGDNPTVSMTSEQTADYVFRKYVEIGEE